MCVPEVTSVVYLTAPLYHLVLSTSRSHQQAQFCSSWQKRTTCSGGVPLVMFTFEDPLGDLSVGL